MKRNILILSMFLLLASCSQKNFDLEGTWLFTTMEGETSNFSIQKHNNHYYVYQDKHTLSGVYKYKANHLILVKPDNPRFKDSKWFREGHKFVLISEPHVSLTGERYLGSTLVKQ